MPLRPTDVTTAASGLPTGVVSFLLTDIVGSTMQWDREPEAMAGALDRHDIIIEDAVVRAGGLLLKFRGEGDATFSVFHRATDAVAAALDAQRMIAVEPWLPSCNMAVRMAVHSGEAIERGGDYFGGTVNRAARLRGLANAREVLVSGATRDLIVDQLPDGSQLVELGVRMLRDLSRPERVYALSGPGVVVPVWDPPVEPATTEPVELTVPVPRQLRDRSPFGFVGRHDEAGALTRFIGEGLAGETRLVLISGEPGAGKTELAAEVVREADRLRAAVLYGRCDEDVGSPYQPWVDALGRVIAALPTGVLDSELRRLAGELGRIFPEVARRWPSERAVAGRDRETDRYLLFRAVTELLELLTALTPVILVLDDIHWADGDSLALLRHVCGSDLPLRLSIIATYRPFEASQLPALTDLLAALRRHSNIERIELDGLSELDLETLTGRVATDLDESRQLFARALLNETKGNPFFVNEILRTYRDSADDAPGRALPDADELARWIGSSAGVGDVVFQRIARLGADVEASMTMASVIGQEGDLDVLATSLERSDTEVLAWFDAAVGAGLMIDQSPGRFAFTHALVAHSLYQRLRPTHRARAHVRVAKAIESERGDDLDAVAGDLAHHWGEAPGADAAGRALGYMCTVGRLSLAKSAPGEAQRWFRQAAETAVAAGLGEADRCEILVELGEAERMAGDGSFRQTLLDAAQTAQRVGRPDLVVRAALANNRGYQSASDRVDNERVMVLEAALEVVEPGDHGARARLLAVLANELCYAGDYERRSRLSDQSVELARSLGDPAILAHVFQQRHLAVVSPQTVPHLRAIAEEACELADTVGDPVLRFFANVISFCSHLYAFDLASAARRRDEFLSLAERLQQPLLQWTAAWHSVPLLLLEGKIDEAEQANTRGLELGLSCGQQDARAIYFSGLLGIRWEQGRIGETEPILAKAVAALPDSSMTSMSVSNRCLWALALLDSERTDEAEQAFQPLVDQGFASLPMDPIWLCAMVLAAETAFCLEHRDAATELLTLLEPAHGQTATLGAIGYGAVDRLRGQLAIVCGDWAAAEQLLADAAAVARFQGAPLELARTERAAAELEQRRERGRATTT